MALVNVPGNFLIPIGPNPGTENVPFANSTTVDAANEAAIFLGYVTTSDGGSHTIDTTGSSSLGWRTSGVTFASGSTIVKVGLAAVDTTTGPPARAANASNVITFDVSRSLTGGAGGITANAWQTHVPDSGSKTIADGDFIAFAVQMIARGGTDSITPTYNSPSGTWQRPLITSYVGATYSASSGFPNLIITFADGAIGFVAGGEVFSTINNRLFNNTGGTKEYGQLFQLPFPMKIYGMFGWVAAPADFDFVLYSDPLGTPVAERTCLFDLNTVALSAGRKFISQFSSPYSTAADQMIVVAFKPGASNITAYYRTLANAAHRITDPWGANGYGVSRGTGIFANANASLDHYYAGLLVGGFEAGGAAGRAVQINNDSLVA